MCLLAAEKSAVTPALVSDNGSTVTPPLHSRDKCELGLFADDTSEETEDSSPHRGSVVGIEEFVSTE